MTPGAADVSGAGDLQNFVARLQRHSILFDDEREALLRLPCREQLVERGDVVAAPNEPMREAVFVCEGLLARSPESKRTRITSFHLPGDMPDLQSVVVASTHAWLTALNTSRLVRVSVTDLRAAAAKQRELANAFWREVVLESQIVREWNARGACGAAGEAVAHFLCELAVREQPNLAVPCALRTAYEWSDIAVALNLPSDQVRGVVQRLEGAGLVMRRAGGVDLLNWKALVREGRFDEGYLRVVAAPKSMVA